MDLGKARRTPSPGERPDGVVYRQQYVRCGKPRCTKCPPHGPGHGPYWYGFYWDYRQRTRSFYVGKQLPAGAHVVSDSDSSAPEPSAAAADTTQAQKEAGPAT